MSFSRRWASVIDSGMFVLGAEVDELERQFAELCGVRFAVGVNSARRVHLRPPGLGIGPGDEVITAANSFIASAGCAAMVGARPILVDVGDDYNRAPLAFERAITPAQGGDPGPPDRRPVKMDAIVDTPGCTTSTSSEDAAQAVSCRVQGDEVGAFGVAGVSACTR